MPNALVSLMVIVFAIAILVWNLPHAINIQAK
jgi:hypothetical protein